MKIMEINVNIESPNIPINNFASYQKPNGKNQLDLLGLIYAARGYTDMQKALEDLVNVRETSEERFFEKLQKFMDSINFVVKIEINTRRENYIENNCPYRKWSNNRNSFFWGLRIEIPEEEICFEDHGMDYTYKKWFPIQYKKWLKDNPEPKEMSIEEAAIALAKK